MVIEKFVYGGLPVHYEITLHPSNGVVDSTQGTEQLVVPAEMLDEHGTTREDVVYNAVVHKAAQENTEDLGYTLRLMRPKEVKKYLRPRLRHALLEIATERALDTTPVKQVGEMALNSARMLNRIETAGSTGH
jgi:hypothetical protein